MPYCAKCGKELKEGVKFCPACGAPISPKVLTKAPETAKKEAAPAPKRSGAVVAIVVVIIVAVVAVVAFLLLGGGGILPVYSGAQKLMGQSIMGVDLEIYSFTENCQDAYNWYKTQMSAEGWTLDSDYYGEDYGDLTYTKGNETAEIVISGSEEVISVYEAMFGVDVPSGSKIILLARGPTEAMT
jgi:hypothetical protein